MQRIYKLISLLLDYPDSELLDHLSTLENFVLELRDLEIEDRLAILDLLQTWRGRRLIDIQSEYVQTFDLTPDHALHLTHHLFEEQDRARGPALVKLAGYFKAAGLEIEQQELPDYLPLLLEYASTLEDLDAARVFLHQARAAVRVIAENLEKSRSPYAPLLRLVERHGRRIEEKTAAAV